MADNNIQGHFAILLNLVKSPAWEDFWNYLHLSIETFETLGLSRTAPDNVVWHACQSKEIVLFTTNRNDEGPDSLEETIRTYNHAASFPVLTLSNPQRFQRERAYAEKVVEKVVDVFLYMENYLGSGRIWLP
jgi:hypothetical protein